MRESLLALLACPYCGGQLGLSNGTMRGGEVWEGALACSHCGASFDVRQGMPFLYRDDASWISKAREADGWVAIHKQQGNYEPSSDGIDLQIPYYAEEPWAGVARSFDAALALLQLSGSERVLDLGAGRGWAAKEFARLGCEVVALDVAADENVGLGRARVLMEHAGVFFERVIGDGENLPFQPASFDLVFCSAALHHATDLGLLLQNVQQVLKVGGRLCAIREPSLSIVEDEKEQVNREAAEELAVGINETCPTYADYLRHLRRGGLEPVQVVPAGALHMDDADVQTWARDLGALLAFPNWREPRRSADRLLTYSRRRLGALRRGRLPPSPFQAAANKRERALAAVGRWCTGELFLLARKV